jgi:hypothetical protein
MAEFIIRPHGRLHDWIADEQGYFREEGLSYRLVGDEERENRPKEVDPATGALRRRQERGPDVGQRLFSDARRHHGSGRLPDR